MYAALDNSGLPAQERGWKVWLHNGLKYMAAAGTGGSTVLVETDATGISRRLFPIDEWPRLVRDAAVFEAAGGAPPSAREVCQVLAEHGVSVDQRRFGIPRRYVEALLGPSPPAPPAQQRLGALGHAFLDVIGPSVYAPFSGDETDASAPLSAGYPADGQSNSHCCQVEGCQGRTTKDFHKR